MTDRITEHYQENPEGARLVSDEDIRGGQNRQAPGKKSAGSAAGKPDKSANPSKTDKSTKSTKTAKSAKPVKSGKADGAEKAGASKQAKPGKSAGSDKSGKPAKKAENPAEYDESGEQSQSVKTPSVMRLVEERAFSENQVVAAG